MELLFLGIAFIVAITIHEFSHAWTADRLGDPTARVQGRLTLNPAAHIDTIGTILVPLFLIITRAPIIFGWAKPVPFDPYNLENPRRDSAIISVAGPTSNIILAILASLFLRGSLLYGFSPEITLPILQPLIIINVILAIFNLIPIHPLDGGKILIGLLPSGIAHDWDQILRRYGFIILLILILPLGGSPLLFRFIGPTLSFVLSLLLPVTGGLI